MMIKHFKIFIPLSLVFTCNFLLSNTAFAAKEQSLDSIAVIVNDSAITQSELDVALNRAKKQMSASNTSLPPGDTLRQQVLNQLIDRKLQMDIAAQAGIKVGDKEVDKAISHIATQNKIPVAELYQKVSEQGLSKTDYRTEIHDEILLQEVQQQQVASRVNVSPQEVADFMHSKAWSTSSNKEYHIEDILISLPQAPTAKDIADARKRADALVAKIHQGTDFHVAAMSDSGNGKALEGGDLGWRKMPEVPSAFADRLTQMQPKEVAGPIQTPNGFHIIHLAGVRDTEKPLSATEQQKQVQQLLFQRKFEEALQTWVTKLRGDAFINMHPNTV